MIKYTVKKLAELSGVSVRTLHHYDKIDLLKPNSRSESGYRLYGEAELLKLQQILFYKEFGFSLIEINDLLSDPNYDLISALKDHRRALLSRQQQTEILINTIDNTITQLKNGDNMINTNDLYQGFDKDKAETYRAEAKAKFGKESVEHSERALKNMKQNEFIQLKNDMQSCMNELFVLREQDVKSTAVQDKIAEYYKIIRTFWGTLNNSDPQAEAFAGLGQLYLSDERYTMIDDKAQPEFSQFMANAMACFAETL